MNQVKPVKVVAAKAMSAPLTRQMVAPPERELNPRVDWQPAELAKAVNSRVNHGGVMQSMLLEVIYQERGLTVWMILSWVGTGAARWRVWLSQSFFWCSAYGLPVS
jgi:hypothetical protein